MKFVVMGRREVQVYKCNEDHVIISIGDPNDPEPVILPENSHRIDVLPLKFHDWDIRAKDFIDKDNMKGLVPGWVFFDEAMARQIINFFIQYRDRVKIMICHCEAGISRSAGVAAALSKILHGDDSYFYNHYVPNSLVHRTILEIWNASPQRT